MFNSLFIKIPLHPLFWCTCSLSLGIVLAKFLQWHVLFLIFISAFASALSASLFQLMSFRSLFIFMVIKLSFLGGMYRFNHLSSQYQRCVKELTESSFDCIATVTDIQKFSRKAFKNVITLDIQKIGKKKSEWRSMRATLKVHTIAPVTFFVGDLIKIYSVKIKPQKNASYEKYLWKEAIHASIFLPKFSYRLVKRPSMSIARLLHASKNRIVSAFQEKLSPLTNSLARPLFLGVKSEHDTYTLIKKYCAYWGIVHYLARSGLHVVLILYVWNLFLRCIPINFFIKKLILLMLIFIYHLLTSSSISFIRALISYVLYKVCTFQGRPSKTFDIVILTMFLILLLNPLQLFFLDFQLSFGLTLALSWFREVNFKIQRFYNYIENK